MDIDEIELTLIIPCLNEEKRVVKTLDTTVEAMKELGCTYEILVTDDGSRDRTSEVVEAYQREHPDLPIVLRKNPKNFGLSRTFVDGAFAGRGKYYRQVCGDNTDTKETLIRIFKRMHEADMIIPHCTEQTGKSIFRVGLSKFYTFLVNVLSGYHLHYYNGNPVYRRWDVMRWHPNSYGFGFQADMIVKLIEENRTYIELLVEGRHTDKAGLSSLTLRNFVSTGRTLGEILRRRISRILYGS